MKLAKLLILSLFLSLKGFSQQAVLTSSGEKVILSLTGDAGTLTGTTLKATVLASSLTSVGTLTSLTVSNTLTTNSGINNTGTIINNGKLIVGASSAASASAVLEASSTTQGFLPPRMSYEQRNNITSKIAGLVLWCSDCGANGELQVYNGSEWTNMIGGTAKALSSYTIGQAALGGIIFYIDGTGEHGLIAATSDQSTEIKWSLLSNPPFPITGATATAIGTGLANTNTIIDIQGGTPTSYAAGLARAYRGGGFDDWYLPSKDELNQLYLNKAVVGGFNDGSNYWSSSENGSFPAWLQIFNLPSDTSRNGEQISNGKDYALGVRAIRSF